MASQALGCIISMGHLLNFERNLRLFQIIQEHFEKEQNLPGKGWNQEVLRLLGMLDWLQKHLLEAAYIFD